MIALIAAAVVVTCTNCAPVQPAPALSIHCPRDKACIIISSPDPKACDELVTDRRREICRNEWPDDLDYIDFWFGRF